MNPDIDFRLIPDIKRFQNRRETPKDQAANEQFESIKLSILDRDRFICQGCGLYTYAGEDRAPGGYFEVHHVDHNHANNHPENLVTVCPFCHLVFHVGFAGQTNRAQAIWMDTLSQTQLNRYCHLLFLSMHRDDTYAGQARRQYRDLQDQQHDLPGPYATLQDNLGRLGPTLAQLAKRTIDYDQRATGFEQFRILPNYEAYTDAIGYWSSEVFDQIPASEWDALTAAARNKIKEAA